jgi:hypothetical protein
MRLHIAVKVVSLDNRHGGASDSSGADMSNIELDGGLIGGLCLIILDEVCLRFFLRGICLRTWMNYLRYLHGVSFIRIRSTPKFFEFEFEWWHLKLRIQI